MDFMSLLGMLGQGGQSTAGVPPTMLGAQAAPGVQQTQQPGFGLGQQMMQGPPGQTQFAPQMQQPDQVSFMQRLQGMGNGLQDMMGGGNPQDPNNTGMMGKLGMVQKFMQMQQMQGQQNGMQNQNPMQNMQHIQNQMRGQSQASQGYLAQGGGIAPQRRIVGNGY